MGISIREIAAGGDRVTPLFHRDRFMQDPVIVNVLSYWENLRSGRIAPLRSELDPRQITSALDNTFVLEYADPFDVRFRLAGAKLNEIMGMELRGMPAHALIDLGHRDELSRIIDDLIADPKIVELQLCANAEQSGALTARMLLLPMQNEKGQIARLLGCITTQGPVLQQPQRFQITVVKKTRIVGVTDLPCEPKTAGFAENVQEFAGPTRFFKPTLPPKSGSRDRTERLIAGKPYLRLVKDD
jgi:hypothetical protein